MAIRSKSSLTETTYRKLHAHVLGTQAKPSGKLKIAELAQSLSVSPSVVREGLSRLVSEGLVVAEPQRGFRVAPFEISEVRHLFEARVEIECLCLADAIENATLVWEGQLLAALHELARTPEEPGQHPEDASSTWLKAHAEFHTALVSSCRNPWYLKMRSHLFVHSERFRAHVLRLPTIDRDLQGEHRQIADAAIARDVQSACALMTVHLKRTIRDLSWEGHRDGEMQTI
ncbi:GntR family transcriptional regulator [Mesorhizobium sp. DCY119]|uniref:GntR family transcriptional regulator n=1 Tax=Mesorhizobium sp. DCY119 TaxID=2108445 RepID=UPI000E6C9D3D|nr:GntR family transcriptional regulator [Mesorhizobium sp. DCY119]RJG46267.1 GntR family transcriptional regulator [Mesorhizobium sp. DCY119]